jgi:hypothetical protein
MPRTRTARDDLLLSFRTFAAAAETVRRKTPTQRITDKISPVKYRVTIISHGINIITAHIVSMKYNSNLIINKQRNFKHIILLRSRIDLNIKEKKN